MTEYIERKAPGLIAETAADLQNAERHLVAAESPSKYIFKKQKPPGTDNAEKR